MEVLIRGIFEKERFPYLIRFFTTFDNDGEKIIKKTAAYHQYHAVNKVVVFNKLLLFIITVLASPYEALYQVGKNPGMSLDAV